jgi:hypothetical protein
MKFWSTLLFHLRRSGQDPAIPEVLWAELVKLATRLIAEEALEGEAGDAIWRDYYEHGAPERVPDRA